MMQKKMAERWAPWVLLLSYEEQDGPPPLQFTRNSTLAVTIPTVDPRYGKLHPAEYNQGVPVAAIVDALARANKLDLLGAATG